MIVVSQSSPHVALRDLGAWLGGGTPSKSNPEYWGGDIPWVSPKDMKVSRIVDAEDHISELAIRESATNIVPAGSILMVTRSGILARIFPVAVTEVAVALNQDLKALIPRAGVDSMYVFWALRALERRILDTCRKYGTTVASVETSKLLQVAIPLPSLEEQRTLVGAIEEQLSRLDAGIAQLHASRARCTAMRASLLAAAVSGSLMGETADDWQVSTVGECARRIQYGTSSKATSQRNGIPVLRMGNIRDGQIDFADLKYLSPHDPTTRGLILEPGDILFNRTNSPELVGKCAVFNGHPEPITFASYLIRIQLREEIEPEWVAAAINSPAGRAYIASVRNQQVGQANVNGTKLAALPLRLPSTESQRRVVASLDRSFSGLRAIRAQLELAESRARALRRQILATAFTGTVVESAAADDHSPAWNEFPATAEVPA